MAMPGSMMDAPPPLPPDVSSAMGDNPMAQVGQMMGDKLNAVHGPAGVGGDKQGPNPHGAVLSVIQTVEKALIQAVRMEPKMQPFVKRALAVLKAGLGDIQSSPAGGGEPASKDQPMTPNPSRVPEGEGSRSFPA